MKKAILKSLMILAAVVPTFAWSAAQTGEPTADFSASFDGNNTPSGWFTSWNGEVPPDSAYVDTRFGGGFTIYFESNSNKAHPYHGYDQGQTFTVAVCADISACAVESGKGHVLWALGRTGGGVALVKTASTTVQVWQNGSPVLTYTSDTLTSGSHLFIVGNDSTGSYLVVDRAKVTGDALDDPADGFQIGSVYGGIDGTNYLRGSGTVIDEVRGYDTKLSDEECSSLASAFFIPVWTWDGTNGTAGETLDSGETIYAVASSHVKQTLSLTGSAFSCSFWTRVQGGDWSDLFGISTTNAGMRLQQKAANSGTLAVYVEGAPGFSFADPVVTLNANATTTNFDLVTVVNESGTLSLYVNGTAVASSSATNWSDLSSSSAVEFRFGFGCYVKVDGSVNAQATSNSNGTAYFSDVCVYPTALSANQVLALYKDYAIRTALAGVRIPLNQRSGIELPDGKTVTVNLTHTEAYTGKAILNVTNESESANTIWKVAYNNNTVDATAVFNAEKQTYTLTFDTQLTTVSVAAIDLTRPTWLDESIEVPAAMRSISEAQTADLALSHTTDSLQYFSNGEPVSATTLSGGSSAHVYGGEDYDTAGTIEHDIILHVSEGTYTALFGGSNSDSWWYNGAHNINGNILVEMAGGTANYLFGGNFKDGHGPTLQSNIDVVVRGDAVVKGSIFGGAPCPHNNKTTYGSAEEPVNLNVFVKNVQSDNTASALVGKVEAGVIGGADVWATNNGQAHTLHGNSSVTVEIAEADVTAPVDFVKEINGGYRITGGSMVGTVTGNTSVSVTAPDAVTFTQNIIGASYATGGTATVNGNSTVTLAGGTYTGAIYAAGYGSASTVTGDATLTLNSGVFGSTESEMLIAATGGDANVTGTATLNLGEITLASPMTAITGFDTVNITGNANIGTYRFGSTLLTVDSAVTMLALTATEAEVDAGEVTIGAFTGTDADIAQVATVTVTLPEGVTEEPAWKLMVKGGKLMLSTEVVKTVTWQKPSSGSDWVAGLPDFVNGDHVIFGENNAEELVTVAEGIIAGNMTVKGNYAFTTSLNNIELGATNVVVSETGKLTLASPTEVTARALILQPATKTGGYPNHWGPAELVLYKDGQRVTWPATTTIYEVSSDGKDFTAAAWTNNEEVNALIDGVWNADGGGSSAVKPDGTTPSYTVSRTHNKWMQSPNNGKFGSVAVIDLGAEIEFDSYEIYLPAEAYAFEMQGWSLYTADVSVADLETYETVAKQCIDNPTGLANPGDYGVYSRDIDFDFALNVANALTVKGALSATGTIIADTITFEAGSEIAVSPLNDGPLVLEGTVVIPDGTTVDVTVPEEAASAANIPFLKTSNADLLEKFTYDTALFTLSYEDGVYSLGSLGKEIQATLDGDKTWSELKWTTIDGASVTPDFSAGDFSITLKATADAQLTLETNVTVNAFTFAGEKSLTLVGGMLTPAKIVVTDGTLKTTEANLPLLPPMIAEGATFEYTFINSPTLPSMSGTGTFVKRGTGTPLLDAANDYTTKIIVGNGTLMLANAEYDAAYDLEVLDGATLQVGDASGSITSADAKILLRGGSTLALYNGNNTFGSITIEATEEENPAKIWGSLNGNNTNLAGSISGKGAVEFGNAGADMDSSFTVSGVIANGESALKVIVTTTNPDGVIFSGENTYSGGTEIRDGGNLRVTSMANLGTGSVSIADTGKINFYNTGNVNTGHDANWNRLTGTGTVAFTASGNFYRTFPNFAKRFTTDLGVENNLGMGLILPEPSMAYQIGSLSGTGAFRVDFGNGTRSLEIIQSKDTVYSGGMIADYQSARLSDFFLSGKNGGKLTYTGRTTVAKPLTIKNGGWLNLTGSWTGAITVQAGGSLGGAGTIGGGVTLNADATLDMTGLNPLTVEGTVTLPAAAKIKVILPEKVGTDLKILSATTFAVTEMPSADVYIEGIADSVQTAKLEARPDGLYLCMKQIYTRTFDGSDTTWAGTDLWSIKESGEKADAPMELASVKVTVDDDTLVRADAVIHLSELTLLGEKNLTLEFDLGKILSDTDYLAAPYTLELLRSDTEIDFDRVTVWTTGLKYGAIASVTTTETSVFATITLPESLIVGYETVPISETESISINFTDGGDHALTDMNEEVGLEGYQVAAANWAQFGENTASNQTIKVVKTDGSVESVAGALEFSSKNTHRIAEATPVILRGYLDDGNTVSINLTVPESWGNYTAVIYAMTDTNNRAFRAVTVNTKSYTYVNNVLTEGTENWGESNSRAALIEGENTMVIPNLKGDFKLQGMGNANNARGCIAAIQLVKMKPVYNLSLAPAVCYARVSGECSWETLEWTDETGAPCEAPTSAMIAELTLAGDAVMDLTGAQALQVSVVGRGCALTLTGTESESAKWVFTTDTVLAMKSEASLIPSFVANYPGTVRYDYNYTASEAGFTTNPNYTTEFAAGFTGKVTPAGGGVEFSGGTVTVPVIYTSAVQTAVTFSGTSRTTVNDNLSFGQAAVRVCDRAQVTSPKFTLAEGASDYTTTFAIEDDGVVTVTGSANNHPTNGCSVKVAHWNGTASLSLSDNGRFIATQADMVLAHDGSATLTIADDAEVRVKGLVHHNGGAETSAVTLAGGKLLIGETGFLTYGTKIKVAMTGGSVGALSGTVELGADADAAVDLTTNMLDGSRILTASEEGATLFISSEDSPFLKFTQLTNLSGVLRLADSFLGRMTVRGGSLEIAGTTDIASVTLAAGTGLAFDGGVLTADSLTFGDQVTVTYPMRSTLSEGGYIVMRNGTTGIGKIPEVVSETSTVLLTLVLDSNRSITDKLLPKYPLIIGTSDNPEETLDSFVINVKNITNGAVSESSLVYESGDLGEGLYAGVSGNDVLSMNLVSLNKTAEDTGYQLLQSSADTYPYHYFTAEVAGGRLIIPETGIALSHITFNRADETCSTRIVSQAEGPMTFLCGTHISINSDLIIDLSAWTPEAATTFIRGAVRNLPASICLISAGITVAPGVTLEADFGDYKLPEGFTAEVRATADGLYLVVEADRAARAVSVNFADAAHPLAAPPAAPGAYPIAVAEWNDLVQVFSSSALKRTDLGGIAVTTAADADGEPTQLLVYNSQTHSSASASASLLQSWLSDAADQDIQIRNLPFEAYRLVLIFSNDLEGAAYAPVTVGEDSYCMDREGYLRKNIDSYTVESRFEIAGDTAWGSTDFTAKAEPLVPGHNILVTDVLTDPEAVVSLAGFIYAQRYSGLAALQIVEAPDPTVVPEEKAYTYTFTAPGNYALAEDDAGNLWSNSPGNTLTLITSEVAETEEVTVTLPVDFSAKEIILVGSKGRMVLQVENNGGALLSELDASAAQDVTVHFPCTDVAFTAPAGVMTFERDFNNNGLPYLIEEGKTLVLGEAFSLKTNMETALFATVGTFDLVIDAASDGVFRRNYPVANQSRPADKSGDVYPVILGYRNGTIAGNRWWGPGFTVQPGDKVTVSGTELWITGSATRRTFAYTQTGGEFSMPNTTGNTQGILFGPSSNTVVTGDFRISGGRLKTGAIIAWGSDAEVSLTVSGSGILDLYNKLHAETNRTITAVFSEDGTLNLTGGSVSKGGSGTVDVTFTGGRITTDLPVATLTLPVIFNGTAEAPTELAPAAGSTLILNAENDGTGNLRITQGTVAVERAGALARTRITVAPGATYEARKFGESDALSNQVVFEAGSILSATADPGVTRVRIAGSIKLDDSMQYLLNGKFYKSVEDHRDGTVTFGEAFAEESVSWMREATEDVWAEGVSGPWADGKTYVNKADVTFLSPETTDRRKVIVRGNVTPNSVTFAEGADDGYRFVAEDARAVLSLSGSSLAMGSGQIWEVPIETSSAAAVLSATNTTYRLIGQLSNGNKTATLVGSGNINGASGNHGTWCTDGVTLAPAPGETQIVSAMGNVLNPDARSHLSGSGNVIITGGGTVQFAGTVANPGAGSNISFQNKGFSGRIIVKDRSTLDFTMIREDEANKNNRTDHAFFATTTDYKSGATQTGEPSTGMPRWRGSEPALSVLNGGTVRFSGCRNIYGGWANGGNGENSDTSLLGSRLMEIGYCGMIDFAYDGGETKRQSAIFGFSFIGDGAKLLASQDLFLTGGSTFTVAGIGEVADPANPDVEIDESDTESGTYGKPLLTTGITAELAGTETKGFMLWNATAWADRPVNLQVGEDSTLVVSAPLVTGVEGALTQFSFNKTGAGRLAFTRPLQDVPVTLTVNAGILGGSTTFTAEKTEVTMAADTVLEAGLSVSRLSLAAGVELKVDPTGQRVIHGEAMSFIAGETYSVNSLIAPDKIPSAVNSIPIKIVGWTGAQNVNTVNFVLDPAISEKGYALEVRDNGLYLKQNIVYVREVEVSDAASESELLISWFRDGAWYRQDDPETKRDYDPDETDAATALFVLPAAYAPGGGSALPPIRLILTRRASFADIRFVAREITTDADGKEVVTDHPLKVMLSYSYDLTNEEMPGEFETKTFDWVSTLVVGHSNPATLNKPDLPLDYAYTQSGSAVIVYVSVDTPAINLNFTGASAGDNSWIDAESGLCGAVPFAGAYWTNASAMLGAGNEFLADGSDHTYFRIMAPVVGLESENGQAVTADVRYAVSGAGSVTSRRGGGNASLAAGYLQGGRLKQDESVLQNLTMASPGNGVESGWQVTVASVPFRQYDLYLLFAGNTDKSVSYPAVRIKIGHNDWRTYSLVNGWAAPANRSDRWTGSGGLVNGSFKEGSNILHFRFDASAAGQSLQIAPADEGQASEAAAQAVGLAALQIVECTDGAMNERLGTGAWSAPAGWRRTLAGNTTETGRWIDATAEVPRFARIPTLSELEADQIARTPYLEISGGSTMHLTGEPYQLSVGAVDLRNLSASAKVHFDEEIFAADPNVILAPGFVFTLPEGTEERTNNWRWVYDDVSRTDGGNSQTSTLQKRGAGDLTLGRMMLSKLQIDAGTLWLSTAADGNYTRHQQTTGSGTFGKTGAGELHMDCGLLSTTGGVDGIIARCDQGLLQLTCNGGQSLPAGGILLAENSGTIRLRQGGQNFRFEGGVMKAVNGGTIELPNALNFFATSNLPSTQLDGGRFSVWQKYYDYHPHIYNLTTRGNSTLYFESDGWSAWNTEGLVLWSGSLNVESGNLGFYDNSWHYDSLSFRVKEHESYGAGAFVNVSGGATLYSDLPMMIGNAGGNNNVLRKIGSGTWVQTYSTSHGRQGNGGTNRGGTQTYAADIAVHEGTFRLNLGPDTLTQHPTDSPRMISIYGGARFDGAGAIAANTSVSVAENATLASGIPDGWEGISRDCPGYADMPEKFKQEPGNSIHKLHLKGDLTFLPGAILEVDLGERDQLTVDGQVTFATGELTVRLKNLPAALTNPVQLTVFNKPVNGTPTISCPEALALDAEVVLENGNLLLRPGKAAYLWNQASGSWSDNKAWTFTGVDESKAVPDDATAVARVQALATNAGLNVNKGSATTDGRAWKLSALILAAEDPQTLKLNGQLDSVTGATGLNRLSVGSTVWKLGDGAATVSAPIEFTSTGASSLLNVLDGDLTLTHPLTVFNTSEDSKTTIPTAIEILKGASLTYALSVSKDEQTVIDDVYNKNPELKIYEPLTQTLTGPLTGEGSLIVNSANAQITLKGTVDNGVNYLVQAGTLTLANTPAKAENKSARKIEVAAGAVLRLTMESALGWVENPAWTLTASAVGSNVAGAIVETANDTRIRGTVTAKTADSSAPSVVTFGNGQAAVDGLLDLTVPAGVTMTLGGSWKTPEECTTGALIKRGGGDLLIPGYFSVEQPLTIEAGSVIITDTFAASTGTGAVLKPDWTVRPGARLVADTSTMTFGSGSLTVESGAALDFQDATPTFSAAGITFEDGAMVFCGAADSNKVQMATFKAPVTVNGVVVVNLDHLDPALFSAESAGAASYPLLTFTLRSTGRFVLGGEKQVEWAKAGWSLRDNGTTVTLEAFGGSKGSYTWGGTTADAAGEGNWGKDFWATPGLPSEIGPWPVTDEDGEAITPSVTLQDSDPATGMLIHPDARILDWSLAEQMLGSFRCDNDTADYTLTASGSLSRRLWISGTFLKTGDMSLTVDRPLLVEKESDLNFLGGRTVLGGDLTCFGETYFSNAVTIGGGATLAFDGAAERELYGLLNGDGTGTLEHLGNGRLTVKSDLNTLKAVNVQDGSVILTAPEQYAIVPAVTLGTGATLVYEPSALAAGGDVTMAINAAEDAEPAGTLTWRAAAALETLSIPRLAVPAGTPADVPAVNVSELRYTPTSGQLILDPGHAVLPETARINLACDADETTALLMGARNDTGAEFAYAALVGTGLVGVEPTVDLYSSDDWANNRTFTLKLTPETSKSNRTFDGRFMGHSDTFNRITASLKVLNTEPDKETAFMLTNTSVSDLGTLTVGEGVRMEITGSWHGDVDVLPGAILAGNGTVGDSARVTHLPAGAQISATVDGSRTLEDGSTSFEVVPSTFTVAGTLKVDPGAQLKVLMRKILFGGTGSQISAVQVGTLQLPAVLEDDAEAVMIDLFLDAEADTYTGPVKLLGWDQISGIGKIGGRVLLRDPETGDYEPTTDYVLKQWGDGLYLHRSTARFWMIFR